MGMHGGGHRVLPVLPYMPEAREIAEAERAGIDLAAGFRSLDAAPAVYDVDGIQLPRPFKIVGIGPVRLFVEDLEASLAFYQDDLGLRLTETVTYAGRQCHFLRANTEHHALALYPAVLREQLGLGGARAAFSFGVRVHGYRQLINAIRYLRKEGVTVRCLPPELSPGLNYTAFATDPNGQLIQLYCDMEQIGWDGRPRRADERMPINNDAWPQALEGNDDTFCGEPFLGPWG
jgi:catechol 2,3-dioxygenase-like lactoylglutathione lyase family enzyme